MTDINGNIVWSATYTAFGEATIDAGSTITNNLRFAGQYFDSETGKHYNWNRYYDPKTGRYTQVDPIGFEAGDANLYRYVGNSPINFVDPFGLALGDWWDPRSYTDKALMKKAKEQYAEGNKVAAFIDVTGASLACLAECMTVKSGILDIPVIFAPIGAHLIILTAEHGANYIANPLAKKVLVAPSLSKFMYYNMVKIPRLVNAIKFGGKILGVVGWGYFAYETYECIKECKNKKHCNEGENNE